MSPTSSFSLIYAKLSTDNLGTPFSDKLTMNSIITCSGNFPKCLTSSIKIINYIIHHVSQVLLASWIKSIILQRETCSRVGEKAVDRGITWIPLVLVGCLCVLSRIFSCVVSWFKSSQTCETTCAQAGCDIVHGPFKGWQKSHCRGDPKAYESIWTANTSGIST